VARLTSVESDPGWHKRVTARLASEHLSNVESHLSPGQEIAGKGHESEYANVARKFAPNSLDFVLVDGLYRDACALLSLDKIRPGGLLIIDNVNWFLPSASRAPASVKNESELRDDNWKTLHRTLSGWRRIWTSDGVTDTALFFKPCA
jgi:predicted O-methyltransferase YrrM